MDIFIEEMVECRKSFLQNLATFGLVILSVVVAFVLMFVLAPMVGPQFGTIMPLVAMGIFYLAYKVVTAQNIEYEYSMVNTEIDVDKIINRKNRKRLTTAKVTGLEAFGVCNEKKGEYEKYLADISVKKIFASADKKSAENYFIVYYDESIKTMLVFSPSEKITEMIEKFNPKRV